MWTALRLAAYVMLEYASHAQAAQNTIGVIGNSGTRNGRSTRRILGAQPEQRDADEEQERPEHRRRELDHRLEAVLLQRTEHDQRKRDDGLHDQRHARRPALARAIRP